jgi:hypothetical protein
MSQGLSGEGMKFPARAGSVDAEHAERFKSGRVVALYQVIGEIPLLQALRSSGVFRRLHSWNRAISPLRSDSYDIIVRTT